MKITLLEKKGKDKTGVVSTVSCSNVLLNKIPLINVDAKIASKTLTKRLKPKLPMLLQCNVLHGCTTGSLTYLPFKSVWTCACDVMSRGRLLTL